MHHRLAAMMLAASETAGGGGGGGTIWDDNFSVGSSIDTAGTRAAGAKPWVLLNAGTTTYSVTGGTLVITPQVGVGTYRGAEMGTLPAGDWTFETKVVSSTGSSNFAGAYLILHESATGKMLFHGIGDDSGFKYQVRRFSDLATWYANYGGTAATRGVAVWLDVARSGSNLVFRYSTDGSAWTTLATVAQTTDFTTAPDYVGLVAWQRTALGGVDEVATFDYFLKTA